MHRTLATSVRVLAAWTAFGVATATAAEPAHRQLVSPVAIGPSFGGGMLVSMAIELKATDHVWVQSDVGLRVGLSEKDLYPNLAFTAGAHTAYGATPARFGYFGIVGASAPITFFDAWVAAGLSIDFHGKSARRKGNLEVGPALYLVRNLPDEAHLDFPVFVYLRYALLFGVGGP